eukprot:gene17348-19081_t
MDRPKRPSKQGLSILASATVVNGPSGYEPPPENNSALIIKTLRCFGHIVVGRNNLRRENQKIKSNGRLYFICIKLDKQANEERSHFSDSPMTGKRKQHNTIKAMVGCLSEVEDELEDKEVDVLVKLFKSNIFKALLEANKAVSIVQDEAPRPVTTKALQETKQLLPSLRSQQKKNVLVETLIDVLEDPHIQALLYAHDIIATECLVPRKADMTNEDKDRTRVVTIARSSGETLGATIRRNEVTGKVVIARVLFGGAAQKSGLLSAEDEICEVNGVDISDVSLDGVVSLLSLDPATVTLKILPNQDKPDADEERSKMYLKAYFNYDPFDDPHIPCKDAGLSFTKGDVLEILESSETRWWQAKKYGEKSSNTKSGIIPSKRLQEKRLALCLWNPFDGFMLHANASSTDSSILDITVDAKSKSPLSKAGKKKSKKVKYQAARSEKFHTEEIRIYEEVRRVRPDVDKPRPIILLGASGQGCEELRRRLVETDSEKFASPITFTSRARKPYEQADKDYHFISRHEMEKALHSNQLVNIETVKNHHFAININSIADLQTSGKTCVISLTHEYIRNICSTDLNCCVIFLKAPHADHIQTILQSYATTNSIFRDETHTEEELDRIMFESSEIEKNHGDYFDLTLIQSDLETNLNQLYHAIKRIESEHFWIPVHENATASSQ